MSALDISLSGEYVTLSGNLLALHSVPLYSAESNRYPPGRVDSPHGGDPRLVFWKMKSRSVELTTYLDKNVSCGLGGVCLGTPR